MVDLAPHLNYGLGQGPCTMEGISRTGRGLGCPRMVSDARKAIFEPKKTLRISEESPTGGPTGYRSEAGNLSDGAPGPARDPEVLGPLPEEG